jgi:hypothetical protein
VEVDMCDERPEYEDEEEGISLPQYGVLKYSNHWNLPKMLAMFDDLRYADAFLDAQGKLEEHEFLTVQTPCQHEPGVMHILCTMTNKKMTVVEDDDGELKAVPKELGPTFGDKWVCKEVRR